MKLYSFTHERDSYLIGKELRKFIYQSFNENELKKIRQELIIKYNCFIGFSNVGEIESFEINIENGVWTA
ncbi:hypothetical protein HS141_12870 [Cetobacterium somerae]|uniref:hypothetical protein n=1 Tax=Cetobacterium somerae TaxID=188913 RepID=UPI00211EA54E|nr:hypothetical protein [Cetobacterium somerae]MCQ9627816.1 hypothetical protein [Cetobacterium somerae]